MEAVIGQPSSNRGLRGWLNPLTISIAVVVVLAVIVGGVFAYQHFNSKSEQGKTVDAAIAASQAAYNKSDYNNALGLMVGMAAKATSSAQKAHVYQMQAQAASSSGKLGDAVTYYNLKHKADPSTVDADAYTLGTLYDRMGQKDNAIAQYKIALQYASAHHNQYGNDALAIQSAIDDLQGGTQ
jgi:Tfp pilus assembly protein PilE